MDKIRDKRTTKKRKDFSVDNVIIILNKIKLDNGVCKGKIISTLKFKTVIAKVTNSIHPYYLDHFVKAMSQLNYISQNKTKTEVTILIDEDDFK